MSRTFKIPTAIEKDVKTELQGLLDNKTNPQAYRQNMLHLGEFLANQFLPQIGENSKVLAISTAEDADYLLTGVLNKLRTKNMSISVAVFWNHHYTLRSSKQSAAPILHKYIEGDYENADTIVIVKSVISGSCVVKYNLLAMLEQVKNVKHIFVVSPVMHNKAPEKLSAEFTQDIAQKFEYVYFAMDDARSEDGEVIPGIGGQIYQLLGIGNQPVLTGYMPDLVKHSLGL